MQNTGSILRAAFVAVAMLLGASSASAQMPMPTNETPTINGAQTVNGIVMTAEIGYPALRMGARFGDGGSFDWGLQLAAPTYGDLDLNGYWQNVGLDLRAPLRFRLLETSKLVGSLRVAPLMHVGRSFGACKNAGGACKAAFGMGASVGFLMDIPLPKIFKLIVGPEVRMGFSRFGFGFGGIPGLGGGSATTTTFTGNFLVDAGIEALWKEKFFFTFLLQIGASFAGDNFGAEPAFREFMGFGYKFK